MEQAVPNKPAGIRIAYKITGIVGLNIALGLLFCNDPILAFIVGFILFIWVVIPATIMSLICRLMLESRPTWGLLKLGYVCRWIAIWILLMLPVIPISTVIADCRLETTKRHCENLIPRLEEWRQKKGHYPTALTEISESKSSRWLLDYDYRPAENSFSFSIVDPSAMMTMWFYESDRCQWVKDY